MSLPKFVGRYAVRREIARGAFATVALAHDEELDSEVAIKILRGDEDSDFHARFVEEARLLRRIRSHSVIGVHDIGRLEDGRPYIVMDFADLGTLTEIVARSSLSTGNETGGLRLGELMQLVDAMAEGLAAIHRAGVIHRDIKPDNILYQSIRVGLSETAGDLLETSVAPAKKEASGTLTGDVRPVRIMIADLGIAKDLVARGSAATIIGGTPAFRPPEQLNPEAQITPAADIFSASAVLWYARTGRSPPLVDEVAYRMQDLPEAWRPFFLQSMVEDPADRFDSIESWRAAAQDAMAQEASARPVQYTTIAEASGSLDARCPYLGLSAFQPEDSDKFFGRESMVAELLKRIRSQRVLVIGGPSGSGKSSVVRAGLVAALRRGESPGSEAWRIDIFTPGRDALAELFYRIRSSATPTEITLESFTQRPTLARQIAMSPDGQSTRLLVIDQFEELFTLNSVEDPPRFVEALASLTDPADSPFRVVLALRADFYNACATLPWLAEAITQNQVLVGPLSNNELRRAVVEPARVARFYLERNLVDAILDDAGGEAGSLPLVSHALVETWSRRKGATLTLEAYRATGGVAGAIRQTADAVYDDKLDDTGRDAARRLLLNLVTPGDKTPDSRRILDRAELKSAPDADRLNRVVDRLTEARLLTVDDKTVQIAHEALLRSWPRLRDWIEDAREDMQTRLKLLQQAEDWRGSERDEDLLLRGARLAFAQEWLEKQKDEAGSIEKEFVLASQSARQSEKNKQLRQAKRARTRRIVAFAALATLAIGASAASFVAYNKSLVATENGLRAEAASSEASERFAAALGAVALGRTSDDPLLALGLASGSLSQASTPLSTFDARAALLSARISLSEGAPIPIGSPVPAGDAQSLALSHSGDFVAVGLRDGSVTVFDVQSRAQVGGQLKTDIGGIEDLVYAPDDGFLVAVGNSGRMVLWQNSDGFLGDPREIGSTDDVLWSVALQPGGSSIVTAGEDGAIRLWSLNGGADSGDPLFDRRGDFTSVAFHPSGDAVIGATGSGELFGWVAPSGEPIFGPMTEAHSSDVWQLKFSPDGQFFATVSSDGTSALHAFPEGALQVDAFSTEISIGAVSFSRDGRTLVGGGEDGRLHVWRLEDHEIVAVSGPGHVGAISQLAVSSDSETAVTLGADQHLRFWRLNFAPELAEQFIVPSEKAKGLALSAELVAFGDDAGNVEVWNWKAENPTPVSLSIDNQVWAVALSEDSKQLAFGSRNGQMRFGDIGANVGLHSIAGTEDSIWSVTFRPGHRELVTASDTSLRVWNLESGELSRKIAEGNLGLTRADISPDGARVAASTKFGQVIVWDIETGEEVLRADIDDDVVWSVRFSPDGSLLLAGSSDEVLSIRDSVTGEVVTEFTGHFGGVTDALMLADDATVVVSDRRGSIHFWDAPSERSLGRIDGAHGETIWRLAALPNSMRFASSGDDGVVRLWDVFDFGVACEFGAITMDALRRRQFFGDADLFADCEPSWASTQSNPM